MSKFPIGTVVRHTSTFLRSIGSYAGNHVNGVVVAYAKGLNFPVVLWSGGGEPKPVNPVNLEVHKAGEAQMTPGLRAAVVAEGVAKYQEALDRQAAEDAAYLASPEYAAYQAKRGILRSSLRNPRKGFVGAKKKGRHNPGRQDWHEVPHAGEWILGDCVIYKSSAGYTLLHGSANKGSFSTLAAAKRRAERLVRSNPKLSQKASQSAYGFTQGFLQGHAEWGTPTPAEMQRAQDAYAVGYRKGRHAASTSRAATEREALRYFRGEVGSHINPKLSQKALREHIAAHHRKLDAAYAAKAAAERAVKAKQSFRWSAANDYTDKAGHLFLKSLAESTYARDVMRYVKVTPDRVTIVVPPSVGARVRYGVHEGFAGAGLWKPRNAFDAWADLTGGLDADGRE